MPRHLTARSAAFALLIIASSQPAAAQHAPYRSLDDTFEAPHFTSPDDWNRRAAYLREHVLESAGLLPMPERTPLKPVIFGEVQHPDYTVSKVYFESLPGFFVAGNLYRPIGNGPFPAILSPHGHWPYGRLENTPVVSVPGRAINLARQGFVVFTYDMIGYNDSRQLPHTFGGPRESLWGLSVAGLQLWNSIRGLDFLETLPYVRRDALGVTGESGGGTQTFLLAAADDRVAVAAPVNMISLHMQGGDLCENPPGLRLDTNNVEIAATIAPRPLLMVSATGDWTANTMESEYPAVRSLYSLLDAGNRVFGVRFEAEHNFNRDSREAMYAWMARWLQHAPADVRRPERPFTADAPPDVLVFYQRPLPPEAITAAQLTSAWIDNAKRQLSTTPLETLGRALDHALGFGQVTEEPPRQAGQTRQTRQTRQTMQGRVPTVLFAADDAGLERELRSAGFSLQPIEFTPFDADAASKIRHFDTYNRTAASQRVADIVAEMRAHPDAALVASGDAALAGLFAAAIAPVRIAVLDVGTFDTSGDTDFLERFYVPGLRRAGDFTTAARLAGDRIVIHNAGDRFMLTNIKRTKLSAREIAALLRNSTR
ncbi:MAG TPA: hypothetical protein VGZ27_11650 [Vicinamibacterales bacterium]|nr:hypothetical protein [Vicinamibacterales bacterium]